MTKLEKMLKYVSEHNDFYKNRIKEYGIKDPLDITQWPILTRKELQENRYNMFSDGYKSKYYNQQLRRQSSSGSSGIPINVYWDYKDWYASNMSLWRKRLQWYGIKPSDKQVVFTLNAFKIKNDGESVYYINEPENILSINVSLIQNESGYDKLIVLINEFEPKWLYIQPFVLNKLIQTYKRNKKTPPKTLAYIESVGEILASDLRRKAIDFFGVPLANMYGSEEMNAIAYECPNHHMHILEDNVKLELNIDNSRISTSKGETIITNLNNIAMPLIKYCQGDSIILSNLQESCLYGSSSIVDLINGRSYESILLEDGTEINTFMLIELIAEVNNHFSDIIMDYRFDHIKSMNSIICTIYLEENNKQWFNNVRNETMQLLLKKCGKVTHMPLEIICSESRLDLKEKKKYFIVTE